jgi:hypothetical protein
LTIDGAKIRSAILQAVADLSARYGPEAGLQSGAVLPAAAAKLVPPGHPLSREDEQAVLRSFGDLFRTGHLSWGINFSHPSPPFFHVTEQGHRTLENLSRDPANPDGYLAHLDRQASLNPVARSYVEEALRTYNADCFRAAAVMIGAAAESLILELRDAVMDSGARTRDLSHFLIKRVIDNLHKELEMRQSAMPPDLREQFEGYWPAFTQQIRAARNDAGHPASITPVTPDTVHAALLIFPELAGLWTKLMQFVATHYGKAKQG